METYAPLRSLEIMSLNYPGCFQKIEDAINSTVWEWDKSKCEIPLMFCLQVATNYGSKGLQLAYDSATMQALAMWRKYKTAYKFNEELGKELMEQYSTSDKIPVEILYSMPFKSIYIDCKNPDFDGFFCCLETPIINKELSTTGEELYDDLNFVILKGNAKRAINLHIKKGMTVEQSIDIIVNQLLDRGKETDPLRIQELKRSAQEKGVQIAKMLQLVLYICAENADIEKRPSSSKKSSKKSGKKPTKKNEVTKWDVGVRVVKNMRRQHIAYSSNNSTPTGRTVRPHVRRGHWSHFWTGPKSEPEKRELILRWVAPTLVNAQDNKEFPTVIRELEKAKE